MNNRPFILRGKIKVNNLDEYIIGKVVKNDNREMKENYIQVLDDENVEKFEYGYLGYIFEHKPENINLEEINYCYEVENYQTLVNYDVIEIINNRNIRVLYRDDSEDNAIVVTNQCNSNCIMCPDPDTIRNTKENPDIKKLLEQVRCIPNDTKHITITGGEPGLLRNNLILLLEECKKCLLDTEFLLLTNGRIFSNTDFADKIKNSIPENIRIAIPIYADNAQLHDSITRAKDSFMQTITGIKKLIERDIDVELRIVVLKKNYKHIENIANFIAREIPQVKMVNIMALEMTGNAYQNKEEVWINFEKTKEYLYRACVVLIKSGIIVNLYNFPLCQIDERLYSIAHKSITDYKVRYKEACNECFAKQNCGGFFNSTVNVGNIEVKPIK